MTRHFVLLASAAVALSCVFPAPEYVVAGEQAKKMNSKDWLVKREPPAPPASAKVEIAAPQNPADAGTESPPSEAAPAP